METALTLQNISKKFKLPSGKELSVLKNINLEIKAEEFLVILGPSGSGKSTLLRIMSGLERQFNGHVELGGVFAGQREANQEPDFSFVFQHFALLPWLTVLENVELALADRALAKPEIKKRAMEELKHLGLEKFVSSRPDELSGGMRQRVGLARALVTSPKVIFMDEPFSELDSFTAHELRKEILKIWQTRKPTVVMVTHLIEEAIELADRIAVLTPLPGSIENILQNDLSRPRNFRSQEFYNLYDKIFAIVKP